VAQTITKRKQSKKGKTVFLLLPFLLPSIFGKLDLIWQFCPDGRLCIKHSLKGSMSMQNIPKQVRRYGFEADYKHEHSNNTRYIGKLYVDKFGREREEVFIIDNSELKLTSIDILDTVDLKEYLLNVEDKTILHQETLDMSAFNRMLDVGTPDIFAFVIPRHSLCKGEDLGTKLIENVTCKGARISVRGRKNTPDGEIECWYSDAISYLVFVKARFGNAENVFRLSNIRLVEPIKELFVVPADYKQANTR
jgi:hypothetical protein